MPQELRYEPTIAVLLPCYNEELTVAEVVRRFRETLPLATVYVYDNNSRDLTALRARAAGAIVVREPRQGKGNVVRRMFADIDADIYLMADGDGTYAPEDAPQLINTLLTERSDMVVGTRRGVTNDAGRTGHAFGNRVFNSLYKGLFGSDFTDIFSGYRVFTRRFVKSFPAVSGGFEIETEMSVHASQLKLPVSEIALDYGKRPDGSSSKLSTFRDGARILWMFAMLMKETQPLRFFGAFALVFLASSLFLMAPVLVEFAETGLVPRMPTWVLSVGLLLLSMLAGVTGVILDSVSRGRAEQKRIFYLSMPSGRIERRERASEPTAAKAGPGKTPRAA
ncbi:glycosyltransferase [Mesorhizobium sp. BR1-1-2]|uniref:glycosyltransferase n=1 Tax=Mesorhizobium sp. BR1-1-2 TaxID=2876652 RepID=UPI001CCA1F2B|nr:glycosyltransferase [Mesorhizobium sp. BR1-1-2]MBZ9963894.1 glycosyltransferase [Mesorhizobium sp. BR1-1-2]